MPMWPDSCSSLSSPRSLRVWGWGYRSRAPLSKRTAAASGPSLRRKGGPCSDSRCRRPARRKFTMASEPIVYVIDDDDSARHSLEFLLDVAEIRVRSFPSADAFLKASPPLAGACIVTDVRMPGTSGVELVEELKKREVTAPVIVITGHADVPLAIQAMKAGVADFIEKPFEDTVILTAIRNALTRCAGEEEAQAER